MAYKLSKSSKKQTKEVSHWQSAGRWKKMCVLLVVVALVASTGSYFYGKSSANPGTWRRYWDGGQYGVCTTPGWSRDSCMYLGPKNGAWFYGDVRGQYRCAAGNCGICWGVLVYPINGKLMFVPEGYLSGTRTC